MELSERVLYILGEVGQKEPEMADSRYLGSDPSITNHDLDQAVCLIRIQVLVQDC